MGNIALYVPAYLILRKQQRENKLEGKARNPNGSHSEVDERSIMSEIDEGDEAAKLLW